MIDDQAEVQEGAVRLGLRTILPHRDSPLWCVARNAMVFTSTLNHGCDAILICQSYSPIVAVWHVSCLLGTHLRLSVKLSRNEFRPKCPK